jgi:hypothetical protein
MSCSLWMAIEPRSSEVRLLLSEPSVGTVLKAKLRPPQHTRALPLMLEALSAWYRMPLHAVLDADGEDVRRHPERWAVMVGDLPALDVTVEWATHPKSVERRRRSRFLDELGSFDSGRRLISFAATGQR